ncbi:hypothetical protein QFC21_003766 [Naganishia friedmannii]|uniref:Uncharacterized protein n=1 Tax=Naganishia friedmannii TaxID=89922 RepID=A0ACC2VL05_9TREE|nr:hypothetical protein QFC21_003766 [Naganishia friedmannii]
MPLRTSHTSGHIHKKRRPVSTISSKEASLLPASHRDDPLSSRVKNSITWGQPTASLPYHEEEYNKAITIPHPRYHPTPEKGYEHIPDTLYGVPVLGDQVDFEYELQGNTTDHPRRKSSLKGIFGKVLEQWEDIQTLTTEDTSYPMELVGMTVAEKQNLASHARQHEPHSTNHHHDHQHLHRTRKSVTWDPELGSITASSSSSDIPETSHHSNSSLVPLISNSTIGSSGYSIASDKTVWPFTRKPSTLSGGRGGKLSRGKRTSSSEVEATNEEGMVEDEGEREPAFNGFEFTPRQYVPLWTPSADVGPLPLEHFRTTPPLPPAFALPTTPPAQQSRHRRSLSIFKPQWKSPTTQTTSNFPPAFMDSQLSPSLTHTRPGRSEQAWPPTLPPFGSAKVYTPPSPYEHNIASFSTHQGLQKDLGTPTGKWSRVDFGNGSAGVGGSDGGDSTPSRTLMYAAEGWLRTQ